MAALEQIYLRSDMDPHDAARLVAAAIGGTAETKGTDVYVGRDDVIDGDGAGGELSLNYDAVDEPDPEDQPSAADAYRLVWDINKYGIRHAAKQQVAARALFDDLAAKLGWPILLVHDYQIAIADWSPDRGLREFPAETSVTDEVILA